MKFSKIIMRYFLIRFVSFSNSTSPYFNDRRFSFNYISAAIITFTSQAYTAMSPVWQRLASATFINSFLHAATCHHPEAGCLLPLASANETSANLRRTTHSVKRIHHNSDLHSIRHDLKRIWALENKECANVLKSANVVVPSHYAVDGVSRTAYRAFKEAALNILPSLSPSSLFPSPHSLHFPTLLILPSHSPILLPQNPTRGTGGAPWTSLSGSGRITAAKWFLPHFSL